MMTDDQKDEYAQIVNSRKLDLAMQPLLSPATQTRKPMKTALLAETKTAHTPGNPFLADLFAATDSPRYTGGEHRIAFSDGKNGVEGHTYGKTLEMAIARAEFVANAVNSHAALVEALERRLAIDSPNVKWTREETVRSITAWNEEARAALALARQ